MPRVKHQSTGRVLCNTTMFHCVVEVAAEYTCSRHQLVHCSGSIALLCRRQAAAEEQLHDQLEAGEASAVVSDGGNHFACHSSSPT